jgi:hypothetical protein
MRGTNSNLNSLIKYSRAQLHLPVTNAKEYQPTLIANHMLFHHSVIRFICFCHFVVFVSSCLLPVGIVVYSQA